MQITTPTLLLALGIPALVIVGASVPIGIYCNSMCCRCDTVGKFIGYPSWICYSLFLANALIIFIIVLVVNHPSSGILVALFIVGGILGTCSSIIANIFIFTIYKQED